MYMKLANNVIRINGYANNKRTHIDVTVPVRKNDTNWGKGKDIVFITEDMAIDMGFSLGLDGITSYNYYNYVGDRRMTVKIY